MALTDSVDRGQQIVGTVTTAWPPPDAIDRAGRWR
jgi:hypothetical protein